MKRIFVTCMVLIASICVQAEDQGLVAPLEQSDDWTALFDGETLQGWEGSTDGYRAEDSMLVCTQVGGNLYTTKTYSDFVMAFQFKLSPGANNGLGIRTPRQGDPAYVGMELQILDNPAEKFADLQPYQYHASIYGIVPAKREHLKPTGEWNTQYVICVGPMIKVILNGELIVDADLRETKPIDGREHPGMHREEGHLAFCGHGSRVEFRDLRIRDFAEDAAPSVDGFTALFNGENLDGWQGLVGDPRKRKDMTPEQLAETQEVADANMHAHWSVNDEMLVFDGKGQNLCTATDYGDFELFVDWKIPAGADSGIYLRGSPQLQIWDPANESQWVHGAEQGSGALWNNKKAGARPLVKADRPIGEWNTFFVRIIGERVTVELNGLRILDRVIMENYWERDQPIYPSGPIELQSHGSPLYFRNLFIRSL